MCAQGIFKDAVPAPENVGERMQRAFLSEREFLTMAGYSASPLLPYDEGIRISAGGGDGIYIVIDLGGEEAGLSIWSAKQPRAMSSTSATANI